MPMRTSVYMSMHILIHMCMCMPTHLFARITAYTAAHITYIPAGVERKSEVSKPQGSELESMTSHDHGNLLDMC